MQFLTSFQVNFTRLIQLLVKNSDIFEISTKITDEGTSAGTPSDFNEFLPIDTIQCPSKNTKWIWVPIASFKSYVRFSGFLTYGSGALEKSNKPIST
jgi:hypothetical protein